MTFHFNSYVEIGTQADIKQAQKDQVCSSPVYTHVKKFLFFESFCVFVVDVYNLW